MKLTNEHLRKIIKEELENVLSEAIPTEYPGLENQPSQFFRAMNDYLGKWFKQNKEMWESDSRLRNALVKLHGGLQNVIKDDSKENAAAASKSMIDLHFLSRNRR